MTSTPRVSSPHRHALLLSPDTNSEGTRPAGLLDSMHLGTPAWRSARTGRCSFRRIAALSIEPTEFSIQTD
jgi:hypothetical protein